MKYVLMFIRDEEAFLSSPTLDESRSAIEHWIGGLATQGIMVGGEELQPVANTTTLSWSEGRPLVTDGPFVESKESVGGFITIEADDLDAAIAVATGWPAPDHRIEIRPVIGHDGPDHSRTA